MENKRSYIVCKAKANIYCPAFKSPGSLEPCSVEPPSFLKRARIPSAQLENFCNLYGWDLHRLNFLLLPAWRAAGISSGARIRFIPAPLLGVSSLLPVFEAKWKSFEYFVGDASRASRELRFIRVRDKRKL